MAFAPSVGMLSSDCPNREEWNGAAELQPKERGSATRSSSAWLGGLRTVAGVSIHAYLLRLAEPRSKFCPTDAGAERWTKD